MITKSTYYHCNQSMACCMFVMGIGCTNIRRTAIICLYLGLVEECGKKVHCIKILKSAVELSVLN